MVSETGFAARRRAKVLAALTRYAAEARESTSSDSPYLCSDPIEECFAIYSAPEIMPIAHWGIFNPAGPTINVLMLIDDPSSDDRLLSYCMLNPFQRDTVVFGLIPPTDDALRAALAKLFADNGSDDHPLVLSLPTYVMILPTSPVGSVDLMDLMYMAAQPINSRALQRDCEDLLRFKGDPWGRLMPKEAPESGEVKSRAESNDDRQATRKQFERWWAIVTDPDHVTSEFGCMSGAWEGAIRFVFKDPSRFEGWHWKDVEAFLDRTLVGERH